MEGGEKGSGGEALVSSQDLVLPGAVLTYFGVSFSHLSNIGIYCGLVHRIRDQCSANVSMHTNLMGWASC